MPPTWALVCTNCKLEAGHDLRGSCPACGGVLLVEFDHARLRASVDKRKFEVRGSDLWRYEEFLPVGNALFPVTLGEGFTHLHRCRRLGEKLGLRTLYLKDETTNPTGSFLDRGSAVEITKLVENRRTSIACASTGNLGASLAAYSAKAGLRCKIFVPSRIDLGKLYQMVAYGVEVVSKPSYEEASRRASEAGNGTHVVTPANPFFLEGEKTTGLEICEQLGWQAPDRIVVPVGSGGHLSMIWKGINELAELDLVAKIPTEMTGVQAAGTSPIVDAYSKRKLTMSPKQEPVAFDIAIRNPPLAELALQAIRDSQGTAVSVSAHEMLDAAVLIARTEGIFAEPAAASTIACLRKLIDESEMERAEVVVCVITGAGLKDPAPTRRLLEGSDYARRLLRGTEVQISAGQLGKTKLRILEILRKRQSYGYKIWKMLREEYGLNVKIPTVYQHLVELQEMGLVRKLAREEVSGKPARQIYGITQRAAALVQAMRRLG